MEFNVKDKVAVVTGSSRGIGYAFLEAFVAGGAKRVYVQSRKQKACDEAKAQLEKLARAKGQATEVVAIAADCSGVAGIKHLVSEVSKYDTRVDILVANAGATWGEAFETHPEKGFEKVMKLNVQGVFFTIQQFTPMLQRPQSETPARVVITSSIIGLSVSKTNNVYGYLASKAAVIHLGKQLAIQLPEKYNITVNTICPGFFPSKMANGLLEVIGDEYTKQNPRSRLGKMSDLQSVILFLCDDKTDYLNGVVLSIDGGHHLMGPVL